MERFFIKIAGVILQCCTTGKQLGLNANGSVKHYLISDDSNNSDYLLEYHIVDTLDTSLYSLVFVGKPEVSDFFNYKWYVYNGANKVVIKVDFIDHPDFLSIAAFISTDSTQVTINIVPKQDNHHPIIIDPLIHPLGSLMLLYLMQRKKGLLIHASAVKSDGNVFLFTGVSGIGKSTMARLWTECGAQILNDDRIVLCPAQDGVMVYNNPMPYYAQKPQEGKLKAIFLLKQSAKNYIKPLSGVLAYSRVLGNFIQQFYEQQMVKDHLELVEEVLNKVKVYEVGFKPDHDIVEMIKNMDF